MQTHSTIFFCLTLKRTLLEKLLNCVSYQQRINLVYICSPSTFCPVKTLASVLQAWTNLQSKLLVVLVYFSRTTNLWSLYLSKRHSEISWHIWKKTLPELNREQTSKCTRSWWDTMPPRLTLQSFFEMAAMHLLRSWSPWTFGSPTPFHCSRVSSKVKTRLWSNQMAHFQSQTNLPSTSVCFTSPLMQTRRSGRCNCTQENNIFFSSWPAREINSRKLFNGHHNARSWHHEIPWPSPHAVAVTKWKALQSWADKEADRRKDCWEWVGIRRLAESLHRIRKGWPDRNLVEAAIFKTDFFQSNSQYTYFGCYIQVLPRRALERTSEMHDYISFLFRTMKNCLWLQVSDHLLLMFTVVVRMRQM